MNQKYRVKEGCRIEHDNQKYVGGDVIELDTELALFHAANIEVVKESIEALKITASEYDAQ